MKILRERKDIASFNFQTFPRVYKSREKTLEIDFSGQKGIFMAVFFRK